MLLFGHTNIYGCFVKIGDKMCQIQNKDVTIRKGFYYLINPGSIGQPRDNDYRGSFIIFDTEQKTIYFIRCDYQFKITQGKTLKTTLTTFLARRLSAGK